MSAIQYSISDDNGNERLGGNIGPAPLTLLGPFQVSASTAGLTTGVALGAPLPAGTVIYDVGVITTTGWNGTTPFMDVGTFSGTTGLFQNEGNGAVELADPYGDVNDNAGIQANGDSDSWLAAGKIYSAYNDPHQLYPWTLYVDADSQLYAVVSQDGTKGGTAVGATTGVSLVYVLCATPLTTTVL